MNLDDFGEWLQCNREWGIWGGLNAFRTHCIYICICVYMYIQYVCIYIYIYIYILICTYLYFCILLFVFSVICMHQGVRE